MSLFKETLAICIFVIIGSIFTTVDGACQSMDAAWDADRGPLVTQPSKSDPSKVMINWSNIIKNQRCVDEYYLWVWLRGTPKERGKKLIIPDKEAVSFIAEVDACVDYAFSVEFMEKNTLWAPVVRESVASFYKTEAIPQLKSREKKLFTVGYFFDPVKGLHDLSKVSIKFPKRILEHANCIKHLEIKGFVDMNASQLNASAQGGLSKLAAAPKKPPKQPKVKKTKDGAGALNTTLTEEIQLTPDSMYPEHFHDHGWHGRPGFLPEPVATTPPPKGKRTKRGIFSSKSTTAKPPIAGPPPPILTATIPPPFLSETIEAIVEGADPCKPYIFTLKVVSPRNAVMGEIDGLVLPPLNQILDYHPPSLKSLFHIEMVSGQPTIKWQQGLGVPAACLPTFFEAVDIHMARLEDDINFHVNQEFNTNMHVRYFNNELGTNQRATLTQLGCKCNSSMIKLSSTDPIALSKIPHLLGIYHFDSVHQGRPFYRNPSKHEDHIPDFLVPPHAAAQSSPTPHQAPHQTQPQPQQPGGYPQQSGGYPQQSGGYPQQSGGYPQQSGGYPQQSGGYPQQGQPQPHPEFVYPRPGGPAGYPQQRAGHPQNVVYGQETRVKRFIGKIPGSPTGTNTHNPYDQPPAYPPPPPPTAYPTVMWSFPTTARTSTANWYFPTPPPTVRPNPQQPASIPPNTTPKTPVSPYGPPGPQTPILPPPIPIPIRVAYFLYWDPLEKSWMISNILGGSQPGLKSQKNSPVVCPADPGNVRTWTYEDRGKTGQWLNDATLKFECVY